MRKIIKGYIAAALCIAIMAASIVLPISFLSITAAADPRGVVGDVDGDGVVTGIDFALMKQYLIGSITDFPVADDLWAGDVDGSGTIDALDFVLIKQYLLRSIRWFPKEQPTVPTGLSASALTDTGLTLSWTSSSGIDAISRYEVKRQGDNSTVTLNASGTSYNDTGLTASTSYTYTIVAIDIMGRRSEESSPLSITTNVTPVDTQAPTVPSGLICTSKTDTTIVLEWRASTDNVGVKEYEVYRDGAKIDSTSTVAYTDTGVNAGKIYVYTVKAVDAAGNVSADSNQLSVNIQEQQKLLPPVNLTCTEKTDTTVTLKWTKLNGSAEIVDYEVYKDGIAVKRTNGETTCLIEGLKPDTSNSFTVKALDQAGNMSAASTALNVRTNSDMQAPSTPKDLKYYSLHDTSLTLKWTASEDNYCVAGYEIYRDGKRVGTAVTNKFTDVKLTKSTEYTYIVKAYDLQGNLSEASTPAAITTLDEDCGNDFSTSNPIEEGITQSGTINYSGDVDCFSFKSSWAGVYTIESTGSTDVCGELYDENGKLIGSNNDINASNKNFSIKVNLQEYSQYYIKVKSSIIGSYLVKTGLTSKTPVTSQIKILKLSTDYGTCITLLKDGTAWIWGGGCDMGPIYGMDKTDKAVQIKLSNIVDVCFCSMYAYAVKSDGTLWWCSPTPQKIEGISDVVAVSKGNSASGYDYIFAIKRDGTVWTCRENSVINQINITDVIQVEGNTNNCIALKKDGTVWTWGNNQYGQLGDGTNESKSSPVQVIGLNDVSSVSLGSAGQCCFALKRDGAVWAWGRNNGGLLADGTTTDRNIPVEIKELNNVTSISVGEGHVIALKYDGTIMTWGDNGYAQLGNGKYSGSVAYPQEVDGLNNVIYILAGHRTCFALDAKGSLYSWGDNSNGECGFPVLKSEPAKIESLSSIKSIMYSTYSENDYGGLYAVKSDGTVWHCGNGLSQETEKVAGLSGVKAIVRSGDILYVLLNDGTVWSVEEDGTTTRLTELSNIKDITSFDDSFFALKSDGTVWAWGINTYGQLGNGYNSNNWHFYTPFKLDITNVKAISGGAHHILALKNDGTVWIWGNSVECSFAGKIPYQEKNVTDAASIFAGGCLIVNKDGTVLTYGSSSSAKMTGTISASTSSTHTLMLKQDGTVWAYGINEYGQLGNGTFSRSRYSQTEVPVQAKGLSNVIAVLAGYGCSYALKDDGTVWSWGYNKFGQLGNGNWIITTPKKIGILEEANQLPEFQKRTGLSLAASSNCIYAIGGCNTIGNYKNIVEEYNSTTKKTISGINESTIPFSDAGAAELNDKIYIAGGINETDLKNRCLKTLQVYDPLTDTWVTKQDMGTPRKSLGLAAVNGKIYAFGGVNNTGILDSAEVYNPSDNTWSNLPNKMPVPRADFAITVCDNKIYLIGGYNKDGEYLNSVDVYDPEANTWTTLQTPMPTARTGCEAVTLNNKIYVLGGWNGSYLDTVEIYDPATEQWTAGNPFSIARTDFGAAVVGTKIYIVGGNNYYAGGYLDSVEEYEGAN